MGLHRAGFEVVGVDIRPQPNYPFEFHQADALTYPLDGFDFIWASPPCQAHTALKVMKNARKHEDLIPQTRAKLEASGLPYVMENVFGAPLLPDRTFMLCGTMFGLASGDGDLRRHRYFETNMAIPLTPECNHARPKTIGIYGSKVRDIALEKRHYSKDKATRGAPVGVVLPKEVGFEAMDIHWMSQAELSQAIPPAYSEFIGRAAIDHLESMRAAA